MRTQSVWLVLVLLTLGLTLLSCIEADENDPNAAVGRKDMYIVVFEQMPIVTYNGKIVGLRGTAKYFSEHWRKSHKRYRPLPTWFQFSRKAMPGWDQIPSKTIL